MSELTPPKLNDTMAEQALPVRELTPDIVQSMLYNAVLWNGHRIHYDTPYTTEVEGYPGLVVPGPLLGDWMHQGVCEWLGEAGQLISFEYSNRLAAYVDEPLHVGGIVREVDASSGQVVLDMFVKNQAGDIAAPGVATVRLAT